ncbi:MAG: hypothetical protein H6719_19255 [Sandaracinaceae bacterium]|nr:hypothetical protein [Sandaracinaceae bacterium]
MAEPSARTQWTQTLVVAGIFGLGIVGLLALSRHVEANLRRLDAEGLRVDARVLAVDGSGDGRLADVEYAVDGATLHASVHARHVDARAGDVIEARVLRDDLDRPRIEPLDEEAIRRETRPLRGLSALIALAVGMMVLLGHVRAAREHAGLVVGGLFTLLLVGVNFDPDVAAVQAAAFGERPWGVPVTGLVCGVELLAIAPALFAIGAGLVPLATEARRRNLAVGRWGLLLFGLTATDLEPALRRRVRLAGLAGLYLVLCMLGWIAYAAWRGV